jgi:hypothetical protein
MLNVLATSGYFHMSIMECLVNFHLVMKYLQSGECIMM